MNAHNDLESRLLSHPPRRRSDPDLVLALDQGGHSSRAIVFDAGGVARATGSRTVSEVRIGEDRVEQDAEEIVSSVREAAEEALGLLGPRLREVRAAGLATQRSSLVCWDRKSGRALSPVISWQDRRASAWLERFARQAVEIHARTGLFLSPHYGASKLSWCLDHLPEVARARDLGDLAMGPLASFLAFRLLRERPFVVDPANASRTLLQSIATQEWDPRLCALFGLPVELLPRCVPTRGELGTLAVGGIEIPLRVLTGDQSAAIFAAGEPRADTAYVNLGTGAFVQRPCAGQPVLLPRLLTSIVSSGDRERASVDPARDPAEPSRDGSTFVIEGTINGAGSAVRRIAGELGLAPVESELDRWLSAHTHPPIFLNGISGLAAPYWSPHFESRFIGQGPPEARVVGVLESILFLVKIILDEMDTALPPPQRLSVSGGLSHSDGLCALLSDVTQLSVERSNTPEATARGLAWQIFGGKKDWREKNPRTFEPRANASLSERCARFRSAIESALGLDGRLEP